MTTFSEYVMFKCRRIPNIDIYYWQIFHDNQQHLYRQTLTILQSFANPGANGMYASLS